MKKAKKQKKVRAYLVEVNQHCEQVSVALRHLADALDNVRSYHLGEEKPSPSRPPWEKKK